MKVLRDPWGLEIPEYVLRNLEKRRIAAISDNAWCVSPYLGVTIDVYATRKGYAVLAATWHYGADRHNIIRKYPQYLYAAFQVKAEELEKALFDAIHALFIGPELESRRLYEKDGAHEVVEQIDKTIEAITERARVWAEQSALAIRARDFNKLSSITLELPYRLQVAVNLYTTRRLSWKAK